MPSHFWGQQTAFILPCSETLAIKGNLLEAEMQWEQCSVVLEVSSATGTASTLAKPH